ncbi:DNA helicase B-like isoform X1 [Montipora foliosa]|uniref:DNA helicase B-like isoform X1 n=1 Tax=Montipora foliosa TaxID=591990 RepID=UPI0035F20A73
MVEFRGFLLPKEEKASKDEAASDSDSENDNDDDVRNPDYHDIMRLSAGRCQYLTSTKMRCSSEKMQEVEYKNGRFIVSQGEKTIRARFDSMFSSPWWMVELVEIAASSKTQRKVAVPSYSIRVDDGVDANLVSLFLTKGCSVNEEHVSAFLDFAQSRNIRLTFLDLLKNLQDFGSSGEVNSDICKQIQTSLHSSPTGKAFLVPEWTKVAHRLFPCHVRTLLSSVDLGVLRGMEKALKDEPWIFGFQCIIKERYGILGCEVKIPSFVNCNLMEKMPVMNRDALYIYNALCEVTYRCGHTYFPLEELKNTKYLKPFTPFTSWDESLDYLKEINAVKTDSDNYGKPSSLFLPSIRNYEQTIVRTISKMMKGHPWVRGVEIDEKAFGGDQDQLKAAKMMTTKPVVVVSGKGGCGKTHVVSKVLSQMLKLKIPQFAAACESHTKQDEEPMGGVSQSFSGVSQMDFQGCASPIRSSTINSVLETPPRVEKFPKYSDQLPEDESGTSDPGGDEVLLTAPTGKAASILGKRICFQAYTLHSVIFSYLKWIEAKKCSESHSTWKFSDVKLLVCDESSLISLRTFATLLNILTMNSSLQQIILLGDKHQLPSIEPGNLLADVFNALLNHGSSVTLRTNHRSESQLIVENAEKISRQQMPFFPPKPLSGFMRLGYQAKQSESGVDFSHIALNQVVKDLLENKIPSVSLPEPERSQFIAFRHDDCSEINELCSRIYNQHPLKNDKGKVDFQVGDKVCVKKNVECFDIHGKEEVKLNNGEIFFIRKIIEEKDNHNKKTTYFDLANTEKIMTIDAKMLKKAKLRHAWARTIHTFQGSEIDTVVYVVGRPGFYQTCQHVYTAVTRGVRQVIIISNPGHLEEVVKRKPFPRKTRLQQYLADDLLKPVTCTEDKDISESASFANDEKSGFHRREDDRVIGSTNQEICPQTSSGYLTLPTPPQTPRSTKRKATSPVREQPNSTPTKRIRTAQYNSNCKVCKGPVYAGRDEITYNGQTKSWVHKNCV